MSMSRRDEKKRSRAREWAQEEKKSYEPTAVRLPEGVEWAKLEVKNYTATWDFLPFIVGKGNPKADEGEPYFMRMYETHRVPALNGRSDPYVCAASAFGKRCAVCDWLRTKGGSADQKLVKEVRAKTRILWLVNDNPEDVTNPVKVFETGYYNKGKGFGEQMKDVINALPEQDDESDAFPFNLKGGYSVRMRVTEDSFDKRAYALVTRLDLIKRDYDYPKSMLKQNPCLDDLLVEPDYQTLMNLLDGTPGDDNDDDEPVQPSRNGHSHDDDDDEPVPKAPARRVSIDEDDFDDDDEPTPAPKPAAKKPAAKKPAAKVVIDDDDEDDEDDDGSDLDDEPEEKPVRRRK